MTVELGLLCGHCHHVNINNFLTYSRMKKQSHASEADCFVAFSCALPGDSADIVFAICVAALSEDLCVRNIYIFFLKD